MNRGIRQNWQLVSKALCALLLSVVVFKSLITGHSDTDLQKEGGTKSSTSETKVASKQTSESLAQLIDRTVDQSDLARARWGISVVSVNDGHEVYARNADQLFTPASNMKVFTTGVALDILGADYRWRTSVYSSSPPNAAGSIDGDLVLYGRGAPDFLAQSKTNNRNSLAQLADDLYARGVRRIQGNVIGDESYFRGEPLGDGWQWTDIQWYFGAEASALSINGNEIDINLAPSAKGGATMEVHESDPVNYVTVQNDLITVERGKAMTLGVHRGLSDNNVHIWGEFPSGGKGFGARLSVYNPALWAARLFHQILKARGIEVAGNAQAQSSRQPPSQRFDPTKSIELAFVSSKPLAEIIKDTNKESINLYAELMLRTLGRERGSLIAASESGGRERGDDEAGLAVIRLWMSRAQIPASGLALHDGSGLSRLNLVTPKSLSQFLVSLSRTSNAGIFRESLPISGRDGTLSGRLTSVAGKVTAKTGFLTYDASLSGYLTTEAGEILAFSILCNDQTGRASTARLIDEITSVLATYPNLRG